MFYIAKYYANYNFNYYIMFFVFAGVLICLFIDQLADFGCDTCYSLF